MSTHPHIEKVTDQFERVVFDTLSNEKIDGTIHLALGWADKENKEINSFDIYWNIVKNLREEGAIYLEGKKEVEKVNFYFTSKCNKILIVKEVLSRKV